MIILFFLIVMGTIVGVGLLFNWLLKSRMEEEK